MKWMLADMKLELERKLMNDSNRGLQPEIEAAMLWD